MGRKTETEHIERIKYLSNFTINETPKYKPIMEDDFSDDDEIPAQIVPTTPQPIPANEADDVPNDVESDAPNDGAIEGGNDTNNTMDTTEPENQLPDENSALDNPDMGNPEPEKSTDDLQNDIIRLNIAAMDKVRNKMDSLESEITNLNLKMALMGKDVEEVREPTNVEKLMNKKADSHPFYFNLNDMWKGNNFQARKDIVDDDFAMKKLDDGTYIANFDDLPVFSTQEIIDSFDKLI